MTENALIPMGDVEKMALAIAKSNLFGMKTPDQALALMLIAQAEGRHPALAARDYDIIQGRPAKKAEAMMRDFLGAGGKVEWEEMTDTRACAVFSHPQGGSARIDWDMNRAAGAGLAGKPTWKQYPRQMLRSRVVSEGVRTIYPTATSGMYVPEEVRDFEEPRRPMRDVTPSQQPPKRNGNERGIYDHETGEITESAKAPAPEPTADAGQDRPPQAEPPAQPASETLANMATDPAPLLAACTTIAGLKELYFHGALKDWKTPEAQRLYNDNFDRIKGARK